jgi:hypothetical protein
MKNLYGIAQNILNEENIDQDIQDFKNALLQGMIRNFKNNGFLAPVLFFILFTFLCSCEKDPIPLIFTETHTNVSTYNGSDGSIIITVTSGTPPYNYECTDSKNNTVTNSTGVFNNLSAGTYHIKVIDSKQQSDTKGIEITQPNKPVTIIVKVKPISFIDWKNKLYSDDGSITIKVTSGIPPYKYTLINDTEINSSTDSCVFDNLKKNTYSVQVTDNKGETAIEGYIKIDVAVNFTCNVTPVSIYGFSSGAINVNLTSSDKPPYTYTLNDTLTNTNGVFNELCAGVYKITVTDSEMQKTIQKNIEITQPDKTKIYFSATPPDNLNQYGSTFSGHNRFSVSFWYNTTGNSLSRDESYNRNYAYLFSITGRLFEFNNKIYHIAPSADVFNANFCIAIDIIKDSPDEGIQLRRFKYTGDGTPAYDNTVNYIRYADADIWKGLHHVVITYDGTNQSLYVDNIFYGKQESLFNINSCDVFLRDNWYDRSLPYVYSSNWSYGGQITNLYIYNEALTNEDVNKLFNNIEP